MTSDGYCSLTGLVGRTTSLGHSPSFSGENVSIAQPFPEFLGGDLQNTQPPNCSFPLYSSLAYGFRKSFTPPLTHGLL